MINVLIHGVLGRDAETKQISEGRWVINFNVASTEKWIDAQGEKQEKTTWVRCAYWVNSVRVAEYLKKGTRVVVVGREIKAHAYSTDGGQPAAQLELTVRELELGGSASRAEGGQSQPSLSTTTNSTTQSYGQGNTAAAPGIDEEDDLAF